MFDNPDFNRKLNKEEMKFIDEKGRVFGRYNFLDVLVALILVGVIGGMARNGIILKSKYQKSVDERAVEEAVEKQWKDTYTQKQHDLEIWAEGYKAGYKAK